VHWTQPWTKDARLGPVGPEWEGKPRPQAEGLEGSLTIEFSRQKVHS